MFKKNQCAIVQKPAKFMTKTKKHIQFLCLSNTYIYTFKENRWNRFWKNMWLKIYVTVIHTKT